jgi:hypothetical protein
MIAGLISPDKYLEAAGLEEISSSDESKTFSGLGEEYRSEDVTVDIAGS